MYKIQNVYILTKANKYITMNVPMKPKTKAKMIHTCDRVSNGCSLQPI